MCLARITKRVRPTLEVQRVPKIFEHRGRALRFPYRKLNGTIDVSRGRWLKAKRVQLWADEITANSRYLSGFHSYTKREAARAFKYSHERVHSVLVRGVRTYGTQRGSAVIVADEMFVPAPGQKLRKVAGEWVVIDKSTGEVVS